jgi:hypothetical protein
MDHCHIQAKWEGLVSIDYELHFKRFLELFFCSPLKNKFSLQWFLVFKCQIFKVLAQVMAITNTMFTKVLSCLALLFATKLVPLSLKMV